MADIAFNISLGKCIGYHDRVAGNDPSTSALVLVPIETSGLEADSVLRDKATLAAVLAGTTNEQTTMGRKVLTDADISASAVNNTTDLNEASLPTVIWTAATGNAISKILVCYRPDTGSASDSTDIPMTLFDFVITPDGSDVQMDGGVYLQAASAA